MAEYADDLITGSIMSEGIEDMEPITFVPQEIEYEVSIIHRRTGVTSWSGTVTASSKKDAQRQFRIKYAHIRSQYTHEYGLGIRKIKDFI